MATIRKRTAKDGTITYEVQIRRKVGTRKISLTKSFKKKVLADQWGTAREAEIDAGSFKDTRPANAVLITELCDKYGTDITPTKEETGHVTERSRLKTLKIFFGPRPDRGAVTLAGLSVSDILEFVDWRLGVVSSDSIRRELQILTDVVDSATVLWGYHIIANPVPAAKRVLRKLRKLKPGNVRERRLLPGEYELLRDCPKRGYGLEWKQQTLANELTMLFIETGLRRREMYKARREYVDRAKRIQHVPKSKTDWKTGKKGRVIPLSPLALQIYDSLPIQIDGSIFGMTHESMSQAFERLRDRARKIYEVDCAAKGIEPDKRMLVDLRLHDLRHEAISRWFDARNADGSYKFRVSEIGSMSGHKDWRSLKKYTHPRAEALALRM
jgi:integrase